MLPLAGPVSPLAEGSAGAATVTELEGGDSTEDVPATKRTTQANSARSKERRREQQEPATRHLLILPRLSLVHHPGTTCTTPPAGSVVPTDACSPYPPDESSLVRLLCRSSVLPRLPVVLPHPHVVPLPQLLAIPPHLFVTWLSRRSQRLCLT